MPKKIDEKLLQDYVDNTESKNVVNAQTYDLPINDAPNGQLEENLISQAPKRKSLEEEQAEVKQEVLQTINSNGLGYLEIKLEDLPTKGNFYPDGTKIFIRAATGREIRHWSQSNETEISDIDDSLNYMLERCLSVRMFNRIADYKDIADIDRLYLILAIRDFTFTGDNNELMIKISENEQIPLRKDNIDFIKFEDRIMKFYNTDSRCFVIQNLVTKSGQEINLRKPLRIYIPLVGVSKWIKEYVQRMERTSQKYDRDFISMAPMLIPDYRGLNDETYSKYISQFDYFGVYEYSILEQFKRIIQAAINPKFVYVDKEGVEQTAPLNFQGGFKALFLYGGMDDLF